MKSLFLSMVLTLSATTAFADSYLCNIGVNGEMEVVTSVTLGKKAKDLDFYFNEDSTNIYKSATIELAPVVLMDLNEEKVIDLNIKLQGKNTDYIITRAPFGAAVIYGAAKLGNKSFSVSCEKF